jgi:hypothetical protein
MTEDERYGPETEVWNHLHSGLDLADMELDALEAESRREVELFGKALVKVRQQFVLPTHSDRIIDLFDDLLKDAWYRHAANLEFGREAVNRATDALGRFLELRLVLTDYKLPYRSGSYLREAIDTFVFGFDAACIAFCGATLEQVLKDLIVANGIYTDARLKT